LTIFKNSYIIFATHLQKRTTCNLKQKILGVIIRMRSTKARRDILNIFQNEDVPLSADYIYELLNGEYDKSTIYRNLKNFEKNGKLKSIVFSDKITYFYKGSGHFHFIYCVRCKKFERFNLCYSETISKFITDTLGYKVLGHTLYFEGICKNCQEEMKK